MKQSSRLDLSAHSLNTSSSKQKFSFSKSQRFNSPGKILCDSFYELPTTRARRSTSFGYGNKNLGVRYNKDIAPVGTYDLGTDFNLSQKKGVGFGKGREDMEITGPMKQSMLKRYIPGPGNYPMKSALVQSDITLKSRLPDKSNDYLKKFPGPGTYKYEQIGQKNYYVTSKYPNHTNRKFSNSRRESSLTSHTSGLAPNTYNISVTDLNPQGRYVISTQQNSRVRQFGKEPRKELVFKHMLTTPGPGTYRPFSDFGNI